MYVSPCKAAFFFTAIFLAPTGAAQATEINIPSSDMRRALDIFIKQSGVQLVYASNDIAGLKSNAVQGDLAPETALAEILRGTQLTVNWDGNGAAIISRRTAMAPASALSIADLPETVVVTGSRVISDMANSPTPVTALPVTQLMATSPSSMGSALNKLPLFMGSTGNGSSRIAGGVNGAASNLNLRNFGTNRTLVLFDGRRIVNTQANGAVNIDVLPQMLMQRVDVVTGGASAVYGSDAVTGVVNFILDKNFEGIKYEANAGTNGQTLGTAFKFGVAAGARLFGGRGHAEGMLHFAHVDQVPIARLPYGRNGQAYALDGTGTRAAPYFLIEQARLPGAPFGGLIACAGCSVSGQTFVQNGIVGPLNAGVIPSPAVPTLASGGTGGYTAFAARGPATHTGESFGRFSYDISRNIVASVNARASEAYYFNISGFNNITGGNRPNTFAVTNPYLSTAVQASLAKGNPGCPGGVPVDIAVAPGCTFSMTSVFGTLDGVSPSNPTGTSNQQSPKIPTGLPNFVYQGIDREMAVTFDLTGTTAGWEWDVYYTHDEAREKNNSLQNENFQRAYAADDAVVGTSTGAGGNGIAVGQIACFVSTTPYAANYPGCVPINPFGPSSMTAIQYASVIDQTHYIMQNVMDDLAASVSGEIFQLPAGPVKAALSGESRWLTYQVTSNAVPGQVPDCNGLRMCSTGSLLWYQAVVATTPAKSQSVYEFAGEVNVPLLKDMPLIQNLAIDLAGRSTHYSVSGAAQTWKLGFDWHVTSDLKFRGTMSVDIRAPTLNDLYQPPTLNNAGVTDLLTGGRQDLNVFTQGNPGLTPEVAHTYTAGTVLTPGFIPNLSVSLDYYRINLYQAITSMSYSTTAIQQICIASNGTSPYCDLQTRPYPFSNRTLANFPTGLTNKILNSATQKTEGVDIEIQYGFDLKDVIGLPGKVTLRNMFSYQPFITNVAFPATPVWTAMPKGRDTLFVGYKHGSWSLNLQNRWLSGWNQDTAPGQYFLTPKDRHVPAFNQIDVTLGKRITLNDVSTDLYLSVQDITDALYPVAPQLSTPNPGSQYPVPGYGWTLGRYITLGIRGTF